MFVQRDAGCTMLCNKDYKHVYGNMTTFYRTHGSFNSILKDVNVALSGCKPEACAELDFVTNTEFCIFLNIQIWKIGF